MELSAIERMMTNPDVKLSAQQNAEIFDVVLKLCDGPKNNPPPPSVADTGATEALAALEPVPPTSTPEHVQPPHDDSSESQQDEDGSDEEANNNNQSADEDELEDEEEASSQRSVSTSANGTLIDLVSDSEENSNDASPSPMDEEKTALYELNIPLHNNNNNNNNNTLRQVDGPRSFATMEALQAYCCEKKGVVYQTKEAFETSILAIMEKYDTDETEMRSALRSPAVGVLACRVAKQHGVGYQFYFNCNGRPLLTNSSSKFRHVNYQQPKDFRDACNDNRVSSTDIAPDGLPWADVDALKIKTKPMSKVISPSAAPEMQQPPQQPQQPQQPRQPKSDAEILRDHANRCAEAIRVLQSNEDNRKDEKEFRSLILGSDKVTYERLKKAGGLETLTVNVQSCDIIPLDILTNLPKNMTELIKKAKQQREKSKPSPKTQLSTLSLLKMSLLECDQFASALCLSAQIPNRTMYTEHNAEKQFMEVMNSPSTQKMLDSFAQALMLLEENKETIRNAYPTLLDRIHFLRSLCLRTARIVHVVNDFIVPDEEILLANMRCLVTGESFNANEKVLAVLGDLMPADSRDACARHDLNAMPFIALMKHSLVLETGTKPPTPPPKLPRPPVSPLTEGTERKSPNSTANCPRCNKLLQARSISRHLQLNVCGEGNAKEKSAQPKPFACPTCGNTYTKRSSLVQHVKKQHPLTQTGEQLPPLPAEVKPKKRPRSVSLDESSANAEAQSPTPPPPPPPTKKARNETSDHLSVTLPLSGGSSGGGSDSQVYRVNETPFFLRLREVLLNDLDGDAFRPDGPRATFVRVLVQKGLEAAEAYGTEEEAVVVGKMLVTLLSHFVTDALSPTPAEEPQQPPKPRILSIFQRSSSRSPPPKPKPKPSWLNPVVKDFFPLPEADEYEEMAKYLRTLEKSQVGELQFTASSTNDWALVHTFRVLFVEGYDGIDALEALEALETLNTLNALNALNMMSS